MKLVLKTNPIVSRIFLWTLTLTTAIIIIVFLKIFLNPFHTSFVLATTIPETTYAPAIRSFVEQLQDENHDAVSVRHISRRQFTVKGELVTLHGDNIQIFEYPNHDSAMNDVLSLLHKYSTSAQPRFWKDRLHLYVKDNLVIFYIGNTKYVLDTLDQHADSPTLTAKTNEKISL